MKNFILSNTLSRERTIFFPINKNNVKMYVCGITPYADAHIGHGRCYVVFDILYRVLKHLGYKVNYVRNFTDIDDKLINRAQEQGDINKYKEIAELYINRFSDDVAQLGCLEPTLQPRVTDSISEIISFIENLIKDKKAYVIKNDVYFDVYSFKGYGKLSGKNPEEIIPFIREVNNEKRNPEDFALWKGNEENLFWKSPWGYGRPGWHIECSVLVEKFLGSTIDIHGGGIDLIFPHHDNEIAQSESLSGKVFANYWIHNAFVNLNKEKMSKSLGNIFSLRDIYKKFHPMVLRYYFLQHHYKTPIDFSLTSLESVERAYRKLVDIFDNVPLKSIIIKNNIVQQMEDALLDDLHTPGVLSILFENLEQIKQSKELLSEVKKFLEKVVGIKFERLDKTVITSDIQKLIDEREEARGKKDWAKADELRKKLFELGIDIQDKKI